MQCNRGADRSARRRGRERGCPRHVDDARHGLINPDIHAQRVSAGGIPRWGSDGIAVCTAEKDQVSP